MELDLCKFGGINQSIEGIKITKKDNETIKQIYNWLKDNSPDLDKFAYKPWTDEI